ncbi:MAG: tRNA (cytidine(34)-2'-O)-methyltransferase [Planctomycetales bacterium]|nr:tRNA (cytidine(34)-2'-O)-methyltransferase [Planctomycetales bacterium]
MNEPRLHVVLYQPQIPQNTGNIGRSCVALGAKLWLVKPLGFQVDEKSVRRAGLDYWQHLDWELVEDWRDLLDRMGRRRMWLLTKRASREYTDAAFQPGDALVFGSESDGLPVSIRDEHAANCLRVPMDERVRSLNLSAAMALVAYEARRQMVASGSWA